MVPPELPQPQQQQQQQPDHWEHRLRRYLLLLASLAATVTYAAGLDPPGGSWVESDGETMAVAGDSILRAINHRRYLAFYYSNATAFAASLVVILLLLLLADKKDRRQDYIYLLGAWRPVEPIHLRVLRVVMVLDLLALMVAYTAGSCREKVATIYTAALVAALSAYVCIYIFLGGLHNNGNGNGTANANANANANTNGDPELEKMRKVLMLLAIFAATITYNAGLKPPGGFWEHTNGLHRPGEVVLKHKHGGRFAVFFYCNTGAFIASLCTVVLLLDKKLTANVTRLRALYVFVVVTLVALVGAYAAGSCRNTATTTYTVTLVAAVMLVLSIFLFLAWVTRCACTRQGINGQQQEQQQQQQQQRSLVLLLATLGASITYQAGLNPPGGVWLENQSGHNAGDPILLTTDHKRYSIFFYCNSAALVASIVVILMVQINSLLTRNALRVAMILDLFGLMGAYIAGSSRTLRASVHVIVMAAAFLVYATGPYIYTCLHGDDPQSGDHNDDAERRRCLKKRCKGLLLSAILMAAITYQAGLSPPGGFWRVEQGHSSSVGSPILQDMYPRRYKAFFYCNVMSFMASIALISLLQDDKTYQSAGIRLYGLYACMLVGMLVLMGAYAAGSARRLRTSIYVITLVGGVICFIALLFASFLFRRRPSQPMLNENGGGAVENNHNGRHPGGVHTKRKYVMLLAMLAASVTYQAGLDPPGGVWPEGYAAGSPVLHDSNLRRYHVFFYSNSISFMASIVVIILLLQSLMERDDEPLQKNLLMATNIVVALDLIGLLVAYAAGSTRTLETSLYVMVLVVAAAIYILVVWLCECRGRQR